MNSAVDLIRGRNENPSPFFVFFAIVRKLNRNGGDVIVTTESVSRKNSATSEKFLIILSTFSFNYSFLQFYQRDIGTLLPVTKNCQNSFFKTLATSDSETVGYLCEKS